MAKKNTLVWFGIAAVLVWYYMRNKKGASNTNMSSGGSQAQTAIQEAGSMARQMVADVVDNTTFIPDEQATSRALYNQDKKNCEI
jgi:hypothetical protein